MKLWKMIFLFQVGCFRFHGVITIDNFHKLHEHKRIDVSIYVTPTNATNNSGKQFDPGR